MWSTMTFLSLASSSSSSLSAFSRRTLSQSLSSSSSSSISPLLVRGISLLTRGISQPDLEKEKGEDAWFATPGAVGVFDGVGGWRSSGVDPSIFSLCMAEASKEFLLKHGTNTGNVKGKVSLQKALEYGLSQVKERQITGSSTACVAALRRETPTQLNVDVLNVGDSGAMIFRPSLWKEPRAVNKDDKQKHLENDANPMVVFETQAQTHGFNFPFQLGSMSDSYKAKTGETGDNHDLPADGTKHSVEVKEGDLVLLASDGLFDNLFPHQITAILTKHFPPTATITKATAASLGDQLEVATKELVLTALKHSLDKKWWSPFAVTYEEYALSRLMEEKAFVKLTSEKQQQTLAQYSSKMIGGKPDDITVTLSVVLAGV